MKTISLLFITFLIISAADCQIKNRPYLQTAMETESWIDAHRVETSTGYKWPTIKPDSISLDSLFIYHGVAGVILFYLELYNTTNDTLYLEKIRRGADYLLKSIPDTLPNDWSTGFYDGWTGVSFTLHKVYKITMDEKYLNGAIKCADFLKTSAQHKGRGIEWSGFTDVMYGSAGRGLFLLDAHKEMSYPNGLPMAIAAGHRLVETAIPAKAGIKWLMQPDDSSRNFFMPNFSHGTAGICYFLICLHEATGEIEFLQTALKGAEYLNSISSENELIYHHEPGGENLYYFGWCHGIAGTSRLYYKLYKITKDHTWIDLIKKSASTVMTSGIPDTLQPGFWNNVSQCCGSAGLAEYYFNLYRYFGDSSYIKFSRKLTDNLLSRAARDSSGIRWLQAEHRVLPDQILAQTGYMQGAAGVGVWLLHLDAYENGIKPIIRFPDDPFNSLNR